jgi:hypothetical protein
MGYRVSKEVTVIESNKAITSDEATAGDKTVASNEMACDDHKR